MSTAAILLQDNNGNLLSVKQILSNFTIFRDCKVYNNYILKSLHEDTFLRVKEISNEKGVDYPIIEVIKRETDRSLYTELFMLLLHNIPNHDGRYSVIEANAISEPLASNLCEQILKIDNSTSDI